MKNRNFFSKFFQSMSLARKINLFFCVFCAAVLSVAVAVAWHNGGCPAYICTLGSVMMIFFCLAIWGCVDDVLV